MDSVEISTLDKKLIVRFSNKSIELPVEWQKKVDLYWQSLLNDGKKYTRGEVFTMTKNQEDETNHNILVEKTDYAHYLYCQNVDSDMNGYGIRVIFTACLVETSDNKIILGEMGGHTARAGIYQLAGGGIDNSDLKDGIFDLKKNISKELLEELNIDVGVDSRIKSFDLAYIKQGGKTKKTAVIFRVILNETSNDFLKKYSLFTKNLQQNKKDPEFGSIVTLEKSADKIEQFFKKNHDKCDEYMEPLINFAYSNIAN